MSTYFEDVVQWHKAIGHPVSLPPDGPIAYTASHALGLRLICEEYAELLNAWESHDLVGIADSIADLVWVLCGLSARLGIDLDAVWEEVRRANFDKVGGPVREDGKQLKPEGWRPPNVAFTVANGRDLTKEDSM